MIADLLDQWLSGSEKRASQLAQKARKSYGLMEDKSTPYAQSIKRLVVAHEAAAAVYREHREQAPDPEAIARRLEEQLSTADLTRLSVLLLEKLGVDPSTPQLSRDGGNKLRKCQHCDGPGPTLHDNTALAFPQPSTLHRYVCRSCHSRPDDPFFLRQAGKVQLAHVEDKPAVRDPDRPVEGGEARQDLIEQPE